jgi:hypothetical protein
VYLCLLLRNFLCEIVTLSTLETIQQQVRKSVKKKQLNNERKKVIKKNTEVNVEKLRCLRRKVAQSFVAM